MYLFQSWYESILFLKPKNFRLLGLVTLRTLVSSYRLFVPIIVVYLLFDNNLWGLFGIHVQGFNYLQEIILLNLFFLFVLIARPSVKRKGRGYFGDYIPHFIVWFCIKLVLYPMLDLVAKYGFWGGVINVIVLPLELFFLLFFLDARLRVRSFFSCILRAFKMFIFNLPFLLIVGVLPYYIIFTYVSRVPVVFKYANILFLIGYICLFTNFYVKRLHDQFRIYFQSMFVNFFKYLKVYLISLVKSWRYSLTFLKPSNFNSLIKESLKALFAGYGIWLIYFWYLLVFYVLPHFVKGTIPPKNRHRDF